MLTSEGDHMLQLLLSGFMLFERIIHRNERTVQGNRGGKETTDELEKNEEHMKFSSYTSRDRCLKKYI